MKKYVNLIRLMRITQPVGFFLLLWPTLWGLWLSNKGMPDIFVLILFVLGVICMRSAGCVINDYVDCEIDSQVQRTKKRPISVGIIKKREALVIFLVLVIISAGFVCVFNINTILLSLMIFVLCIVYPYLKRYIYFPQLILGILFSCPILMGFTATNHSINSTAWLLFITNSIWTISYDTQYAIMDRIDDQSIGIKSLAVLFGDMDRLIIGILQLCTIFMLGVIGWKEQLSIIFYCFALIGTAIVFIWQHILIFQRDQMNCLKAFLSNNYVGLLIFLGIFFNFC